MNVGCRFARRGVLYRLGRHLWLKSGRLARPAMEKLMNVGGYRYPQSELIRKHYYAGQRAQLTRLLGRRFGELPTDLVKRIEAGEPDDLARWTDRFADGASLQGIFAAAAHEDDNA